MSNARHCWKNVPPIISNAKHFDKKISPIILKFCEFYLTFTTIHDFKTVK